MYKATTVIDLAVDNIQGQPSLNRLIVESVFCRYLAFRLPGSSFPESHPPALDSLGPFHGTPKLADYLAPNATFVIYNGVPVQASSVLSMLEAHAQASQVWACHGNSLGYRQCRWFKPSRAVVYESTSVAAFKEDKEGVEVKIKEFDIIAGSSGGKGLHGLRASRSGPIWTGRPWPRERQP